jgi:hypothetical protein
LRLAWAGKSQVELPRSSPDGTTLHRAVGGTCIALLVFEALQLALTRPCSELPALPLFHAVFVPDLDVPTVHLSYFSREELDRIYGVQSRRGDHERWRERFQTCCFYRKDLGLGRLGTDDDLRRSWARPTSATNETTPTVGGRTNHR